MATLLVTRWKQGRKEQKHLTMPICLIAIGFGLGLDIFSLPRNNYGMTMKLLCNEYSILTDTLRNRKGKTYRVHTVTVVAPTPLPEK